MSNVGSSPGSIMLGSAVKWGAIAAAMGGANLASAFGLKPQKMLDMPDMSMTTGPPHTLLPQHVNHGLINRNSEVEITPAPTKVDVAKKRVMNSHRYPHPTAATTKTGTTETGTTETGTTETATATTGTGTTGPGSPVWTGPIAAAMPVDPLAPQVSPQGHPATTHGQARVVKSCGEDLVWAEQKADEANEGYWKSEKRAHEAEQRILAAEQRILEAEQNVFLFQLIAGLGSVIALASGVLVGRFFLIGDLLPIRNHAVPPADDQVVLVERGANRADPPDAAVPPPYPPAAADANPPHNPDHEPPPPPYRPATEGNLVHNPTYASDNDDSQALLNNA